jgi:hypothetical protein
LARTDAKIAPSYSIIAATAAATFLNSLNPHSPQDKNLGDGVNDACPHLGQNVILQLD